MATGSGLDAQIGFKNETTVGTKVTVDRFFNFNSSDLTFDPTYLEGTGLQAGRKFKSVNQVGIARRSATGKIEVPVMTQGFGWFWQHFIGSAGTAALVSGGTLAYEQFHTPGALWGKSFTTQVGKPEPSTGTVKPFTYNGCKMLDWTLTFADNAKTLCDFTVDAWDESTSDSLAVASYETDNIQWDFSQVTNFSIGDTASTTGGKTTITGGSPVTAVVSSLAIAGKNSLSNERFGLGSAGVKREQLENDFTSITGTFKAEYDSTNFISEFDEGTSTALQIDSFGAIIEGTTKYQLSVIIPAVKITKAPVAISGPDLVTVDGEFTVYDPDDGQNPPIMIHIVSIDTVP